LAVKSFVVHAARLNGVTTDNSIISEAYHIDNISSTGRRHRLLHKYLISIRQGDGQHQQRVAKQRQTINVT